MPGIEDFIAQAEQGLLPGCIASDQVQIVDAGKLTAAEANEQLGACIPEFVHRQVNRPVTEALAGRLQQVGLSGGFRTRNPGTMYAALACERTQVIHDCLIAGRMKGFEDRMVIEAQW